MNMKNCKFNELLDFAGVEVSNKRKRREKNPFFLNVFIANIVNVEY